MTLKHENHSEQADLESELRHLDQTKAEITIANTSPKSTDKGFFWWDYSGRKFYARDKDSGDWVSVTLS